MAAPMPVNSFYSCFGKRWLDFAISLLGLTILSPFLGIVALAVRFSSSGPALFAQERVGLFGNSFRILKFRTMCVSSEASQDLLTTAGDRRVTPLGKWLRSTKIDELPQLFNVLRGDMSLVGPRPEVPLYTSRYTKDQQRVFVVRPGITGPSIIINEEELMARSDSKEVFYLAKVLPAKLAIDIGYCESVSFAEDLRLIFLTLFHIRRRPDLESDAAEIRHLAGAKTPIGTTR